MMWNSKYIFCLLLVTLLIPATGFVQTISGVSDITLDSIKLKKLNQLLILGELSKVPREFYKETFDDELADLVVFIDETQKKNEKPGACIQLIKGDSKRDELFGEHTLYVMVFWKTRNTCKSDFFCNRTIPIRLSSLDQTMHSGEFAIFTTLNFITANFASGLLAKDSKNEQEKSIESNVPTYKIGEIDSAAIYYALGSLTLKENTINRVHIGGKKDKNTCLATFGNYSPSWITTSIGIMSTFNRCGDKKDTTSIYPRYDPFLFGHVYIYRPLLPKPRWNNGLREWWEQMSFSAVVGTKISKDLMDDVFVGLCMGHVFNRLSLVTGLNYRRTLVNNHFERIWHPSVGLTFMF